MAKANILEKLTDEEIDAQFTDVIREQMTDKEFWAWVSEWLDAEEILTQAENWDRESKIETIKNFYASQKKRKN